MQASLSVPAVTARRKRLLANVRGEILEIGFGTGLNLPFYPTQVRQITVAEPNSQLSALGRKRIQSSPIEIDFHPMGAEQLPFANQTFDSVVSSFTLCSILEVTAALAEIRRVLKPDGCFYFLEHGLSPDPVVCLWQNRLTPLYSWLACGCHLNRDMVQIIEQGGFTFLELESIYLPGEIKISGYTYQGVATPVR